ncbi:MAG: L-rhamnose isomerase [Verrucomicrobiae bacterium]|nr:L-rhamnose isomerase [Verrucomicrobiae bacterium]
MEPFTLPATIAPKDVDAAYVLAQERYAAVGVDTEAALSVLAGVSVSIHCWQGDDVGGFEARGGALGDGLAVTGDYPGKARTPDELRMDFERVLAWVPGRHRFNLHASYADTGGVRVDRDALEPGHFASWIDWAKGVGIGLDFNPTFFGHPRVERGWTLTHPDAGIREFWVEHGRRCRAIGEAFGRALGTPCLTNLWIPDGMKDTPADRRGPRERLRESLEAIYREPCDPRWNEDSVEPKLFGIGSESYTAGSHEFYLGYAASRGLLLTLDSGHYHPTEGIADKISAVLCHLPRLALHVSRGVRWDSDHVVTLTDDLQAIAQEVVWGGYLDRVRLGLDYFDASINRVAAWVIGSRSLLKALLLALLSPVEAMREAERAGDYGRRLALLEEARLLPAGAVWSRHCEVSGVPDDFAWWERVREYERGELSRRG